MVTCWYILLNYTKIWFNIFLAQGCVQIIVSILVPNTKNAFLVIVTIFIICFPYNVKNRFVLTEICNISLAGGHLLKMVCARDSSTHD